LGALDTGTFILAEAGLLKGKRAIGHYEHIDALRELYPAIKIMEEHLEEAVSIPEICSQIDISQRQLDRLYSQIVHKSPATSYRDVRLDRALGLVTQTGLSLTEIAIASGFSNQSHYSKAYRQRFGLTPRRDRLEGRIPFDFRARPMHQVTH